MPAAHHTTPAGILGAGLGIWVKFKPRNEFYILFILMGVFIHGYKDGLPFSGLVYQFLDHRVRELKL